MPDNLIQIPPRQQFPIAEISAAAQALIDLLNALGGDPDLEDNGDDEHDGTELDVAWVEWDRMRGASKRGPNITGNIAGRFGEDDEDDDGDGECTDDEPGFDDRSRVIANPRGAGPGCAISDPDFGAKEAGEFEEGV